MKAMRLRPLLLALFLAAAPQPSAEAAQTDDGFILLPGGTFTMGSPTGERQRQDDETQHQVTVSVFYVDPSEVTQGDYETLTGDDPSDHRAAKTPAAAPTSPLRVSPLSGRTQGCSKDTFLKECMSARACPYAQVAALYSGERDGDDL